MVKNRNDDLARAFGELLKELRSRAELSQEQFAFRAQLDRRTIGRIESGQHQPTLSALFLIAQGIGIKPHTLVAKLETFVAHDS